MQYEWSCTGESRITPSSVMNSAKASRGRASRVTLRLMGVRGPETKVGAE